jgi:hypothetical protein
MVWFVSLYILISIDLTLSLVNRERLIYISVRTTVPSSYLLHLLFLNNDYDFGYNLHNEKQD